jgi:DNA-binding MarR family transcriptional regulator
MNLFRRRLLMENQNLRLEWLLECLIQVIGRIGLKNKDVLEIVGKNNKQVKAYNLCDGSLTISEIAKMTKIDQGNLSRTVERWVNNGIMFRFKDRNGVRLLHVFPISNSTSKK